MYGLPPGDFEGTTIAFFEHLVHPDDRERVMRLSEESIKTGKSVMAEWRVRWPDGSIHWISGHWQALMNECREPTRMIGVNIDVTERKIAEQELARTHERLHLAIESGSVGGWDYDLKTNSDVWF